MSDPYEREAAKAAINTLQRTLIRVTEHRDKLVAALEKIASLNFIISLPDRMDAVRDIANESLKKIQP